MGTAILAFIGAVLGALISGFVYWKITQKVEANKAQIAEIEERNKFRLAALDKRMQAHQDAYKIVYQMIKVDYNSEEFGDLNKKCWKWWDKNCLYLEANARKSFNAALNAMVIFGENTPASKQARGELFNKAIDDIESGIYLPPIGDYERESKKTDR